MAVDYDALAKSSGAVVDYDALASEHGGAAAGPAPDFKASNDPPSQSLWDMANTPLVPQIAEAAHAIADHISMPRLDESQMAAQIKGFLAGATEGVGNLAAGYTSPVGIALMLSGLSGESTIGKAVPGLKSLLELPAVKGLQRAVQAGAGAGFAAHGASQVATAPTLAGKAQGVVEAATGALGALSSLPSPSRANQPILVNPNAAESAAAQFGLSRGVPVDAGMATGNKAVKGVQFLSDRSLGGSLIAGPAREAQTAALAKVGGELADQARGVAVSPEQAGQGIRDALVSKQQAHTALADQAYEKLRQLEEQPGNRMNMPMAPAPVDAINGGVKGQLRRIVHEMDASGLVQGKLQRNSLDDSGTTYQARTGGAAVFHDITERLGYEPTRAAIQGEIEQYLAGGKETAAVKAAAAVAQDRYVNKLNGISTPELPPSAMQIPTRLEASRVTSQSMGFPVDTTAAKQALRPVYEQMTRQMPITQQQASPGLKAIQNILEGPDNAPLSQVDRDLSAIKAVARQHGGLAKMAAGKLDQAVQLAASYGGPDVVNTLHQGRQATIAKVKTEDLIAALPGGKMEEPLAVFKRATQPKDGGIEFLRAVKEQTPQALPQIARAKLEELLSLSPDKQFAEWNKVGTETRKVLFPRMGQSQELDHFFLLSKRLAENPNPSGTAMVASLGVQGGLLANPVTFVPALLSQVGAAGLSAMLHNPNVARALTQTLSVAAKPAASGAARAAALASLSSAVRRAGLPALSPALGQDESRLATGAPRQ